MPLFISSLFISILFWSLLVMRCSLYFNWLHFQLICNLLDNFLCWLDWWTRWNDCLIKNDAFKISVIDVSVKFIWELTVELLKFLFRKQSNLSLTLLLFFNSILNLVCCQFNWFTLLDSRFRLKWQVYQLIFIRWFEILRLVQFCI